MKVAVVGSRNFKDERFVKDMMFEAIRFDNWVLISGGAKGVDTWAEEVADMMHWKKQIIKPDWNKHGKSAGFIRNEQIIKEADIIYAFWDGGSKGTKHDIDLAIKYNKPMNIYVRN